MGPRGGTIKLAEQVSLDIVTPAVKELRYAGRRIVDALNAAARGDEEAVVRALLEDARFDCHRARHDAIDAAFSKIAVDLDLLTGKLGHKAVLVAYPSLENFWTNLDRAKGRITATRENRHQRNEIYADLEAIDLRSLVDDYHRLRRSEALMRRVAAKDRIAFWITVALALAGYALALYLWRYPPAAAMPRAAAPPHAPAKSETSKVPTDKVT